jgi:branched-chain amino acid transport system ATP-binding protein
VIGSAPLLSADGITAGYGKMDILHDVALEVRAGEIVSVIGPNGAGKSTAFKTIVAFLTSRPTPRGPAVSSRWSPSGARS